MNPDEAQDNFINFIEKDNYQNGILILKGMLAMKQELQSNKGDWNGYKPVEDWSWMKKDIFYLVTNGSGIYIINNFGLHDKFYYWRIRDLNWRDMVEIDWLKALIEQWSEFDDGVNAEIDWVKWATWSRFEGEWWLSSPQSNVWVKGPIIPIIPIPSSMMDGFMNWTKNPLED